MSPDGQTIVRTDGSGTWQFYPASSGTAPAVPGMTAADVVVSWSADGASLFVHAGTDVPARLDRVDLASGARTLVREFAPIDRAGRTRTTPTGAYAYDYTKRISTLFVVAREIALLAHPGWALDCRVSLRPLPHDMFSGC